VQQPEFPVESVTRNQRHAGNRKLKTFGILAAVPLLIAGVSACGGSDDALDLSADASEASPTTGAEDATPSVEEEIGDTESASDEGSLIAEEDPPPEEEPTPELGPPITVTVVLDVDRDGNISDLMADFGEQGWCSRGLVAALDSSGGDAVRLEVFGIEQPFTERFQPSPMNGDDLPCKVEAEIQGVPSGAQSYSATQTGGQNSILAGKATVTGDELERNANIINLE